jgi:NAD-dependent deacetylase sirtuin 7
MGLTVAPETSFSLFLFLHVPVFSSEHVCEDEYFFRIEKRKRVKERLQEIEDPPDLLAEKCHKLAEALANSTNLVVYTGAGVSTAARIPDYRGTNGIWTLLQQGKDIG